MKKNSYKLLINEQVSYKRSYNYDYSRTKGIELSVSKKAACISADMTTSKTLRDIIYGKQNLFSDGIKKACLCQILLYGRAMKIKTVALVCNSVVEEKIEFKDEPVVYSIINSSIKIPKNWLNKNAIEDVLFMPKTKQDSRVAALYAFLCARTKIYENEKFMYYWMAVNGIYNFLSNNVMHNYKSKDSSKMNEIEQLTLFSEYLGYSSEVIVQTDSLRIARLVKNEIDSFSRRNIEIFKAGVFDKDFIRLVENYLVKDDGSKYNVSPEAYMYLILPYTSRCELFHANKPIALFCMAEEHEVVVMRAINKVLDYLVLDNLPELFGIKNMIICPRLSETETVKRLKNKL